MIRIICDGDGHDPLSANATVLMALIGLVSHAKGAFHLPTLRADLCAGGWGTDTGRWTEETFDDALAEIQEHGMIAQCNPDGTETE